MFIKSRYTNHIMNVAEAMVRVLLKYGINKVFLVPGTDYPAFIEAFYKLGINVITTPHETTAVSMAMGYSIYENLGVVAVHTVPGLVNALGNIISAKMSRIPLLVLAGKSPYTEKGNKASRDLKIHWSQDLNQSIIAEQAVKWQHEIRSKENAVRAIERAIQIALSEPMGPTLVVIPREITIENIEPTYSPIQPSTPYPSYRDLRKVKEIIKKSYMPVIITSRAGRKADAFLKLKQFADQNSIPVVGYAREFLNYPTDGVMALDRIPKDADLLLCIECDIPFVPKKGDIDAPLIIVDAEPNRMELEVFGFRNDITITSDTLSFVEALSDENFYNEEREEEVTKLRKEEWRRKEERLNEAGNKSTIDPVYLSNLLSKTGAVIINEYDFNPAYAILNRPLQYIGNLFFGYLGYGAGIALASRMKNDLVICTLGDGTYHFNVPNSFHYVSSVYNLPILYVIYDNGSWFSTEEAIKEVLPESEALARGKTFTDIVRFELYKISEVFNGRGEMVEKTNELKGAIQRGLESIKSGKQYVIHTIVEKKR